MSSEPLDLTRELRFRDPKYVENFRVLAPLDDRTMAVAILIDETWIVRTYLLDGRIAFWSQAHGWSENEMESGLDLIYKPRTRRVWVVWAKNDRPAMLAQWDSCIKAPGDKAGKWVTLTEGEFDEVE